MSQRVDLACLVAGMKSPNEGRMNCAESALARGRPRYHELSTLPTQRPAALSTDPSAAADDYLAHYFDLIPYRWLYVLSVGGFLSLFLIVFQPFGVSNYQRDFQVSLSFVLSVHSTSNVCPKWLVMS